MNNTESLYITKDKFDLLEKQFRKLVTKYDCKFSIECNNVTSMNILANYLYTDFYINVPEERRKRLIGIAEDLYKFYLNLSDEISEDESFEEDDEVEVIHDYAISTNNKYLEIDNAVCIEDAEFVHDYERNSGHIPVFYAIYKWFKNTNVRNLKICDDVLGITHKRSSIEEVANKYSLSAASIKGIVSKRPWVDNDIFRLLQSNFITENYRFLNHCIFLNIDAYTDNISEDENVELSNDMFCGIMSLFDDYKTVSTEFNEDVYTILVNDSRFDSSFVNDWELLKRSIYGKKRKYPVKYDISSLFLYDCDDKYTAYRQKDIKKTIKDIFDIEVIGKDITLPVTSFDIAGYAKRLSDDKGRPLSLKTLIDNMKIDYPENEWLDDDAIKQRLNESTLLTCKEMEDTMFFKSRELHQYNMGIIFFFDYWTRRNKCPVAIKRALDRMYVTTEEIITTLDVCREYFRFYKDEYGLFYVGATGKDYGGNYWSVRSSEIE